MLSSSNSFYSFLNFLGTLYFSFHEVYPYRLSLRAPIVGTLDQDRTDILRLLHERYVDVDMSIVEDYERLRLQDFGRALGAS